MMRWSSFESKVVVAFGAATMVVSGLALSTWEVADDATQAAQMVARTQQLLNNLARIRGYSLQAELATQNFRLTGSTDHLEERDAAIAGRELSLENVQQLTIANPDQQVRWQELRKLIDQRMSISRQIENLRKTQGQEAATAFAATAPLASTRSRTYELLTEMDDRVRQQLAELEAEHTQARKRFVVAGVLVAATLILLLVACHLLIRRQLRASEASQRALADNEENLATTLHSIGDAVLATDTEGRVTRMNSVAERLTGWPLDQALGRSIGEVFDIIHEQTRKPAQIPIEAVLSTGSVQTLADHTSLIARDGTECPISDSAAPIRDSKGQLRGAVLVFRDVTTERTAERIIREHNSALKADVHRRTMEWHESQNHLNNVISTVPALIAYVNSEQRYVYVNSQYREFFAPNRDDITGETVKDILGEQRYALAGSLIGNVIAGESQTYDWQPSPGLWQTIQYIPRLQANGDIDGYYILGTDITERKKYEERIQTLNAELEQRVYELERIGRALRTLSAGNRTMLRATEEQNLLESMCRAIVTSGGYGMAAVWYVSGDTNEDLIPMAECNYPGGLAALRDLGIMASDSVQGQSLTATAIRSGKVQCIQDLHIDPKHIRWRDNLGKLKSGASCPLLVNGNVIGALSIYDTDTNAFGEDEIALLTDSADDLAFGISTLRTRNEQQRVQAEMNHILRHDSLTGLPNAIEFQEVLTAKISDTNALPAPLAALQFNIERLGEINDVLGFSNGDRILRDFGQRLKHYAPEFAYVARLRGDEFAVIAPAKDMESATALADDLEMHISRPFQVADIELDVSARIGIALFPEHGKTADDILRRMGKSTFQAKARGLSRCVFDTSYQKNQAGRLTMAGELRRAIIGNQLRIFLQPKVEFLTGHVCGAEALVRWMHPIKGLIPPGLFIDLAEQTGLIKPLTEWVIVAALDLLQNWQEKGCAIPIAVNISARNFRDEKLFDKYRQWHSERTVSAGLLEVEITESTVMENADYALKALRELRNAGIPLYVDDFGTGYSSLSYLQKLPVDYIKIDQSFVSAMDHDKDSATIVRSTIDLVHDLGRKTVAEGVETKEHWDLLKELGCDIAQGYFIAKPMPASEFPKWAEDFRARQLQNDSLLS
ncbi:EAL domain-containing protein [Comamonas testosteroni]|uniref:EAL domain-containing protein n=1 Tax=Comamonas testosteroni TaxID=285 RepID=UPI0026EE5621|nr:EAL domain-containing protein [Comamonas testosteroni]